MKNQIPKIVYMDNETAEKLVRLSERTERSQSGVIRWLIKEKASELLQFEEGAEKIVKGYEVISGK